MGHTFVSVKTGLFFLGTAEMHPETSCGREVLCSPKSISSGLNHTLHLPASLAIICSHVTWSGWGRWSAVIYNSSTTGPQKPPIMDPLWVLSSPSNTLGEWTKQKETGPWINMQGCHPSKPSFWAFRERKTLEGVESLKLATCPSNAEVWASCCGI